MGDEVLRTENATGYPGAAILPARPEPVTDHFIRSLWCGTEPDPIHAWPGLRSAIKQFGKDLAAVDAVVRRAVTEGAVSVGQDEHEDLRAMAEQCLAQVPVPKASAPRGKNAEHSMLRIVLMGRTQAGKSTLLEALSYGNGERRGDGRQRFSRDVCVRSVQELRGVEVIDTPGVGAKDGAADYARAFEQVPNADVVLWVASNNSVQEETARALRTLGVLGKPIIIVLNCRWDLDHPLKRLDFIDDPRVAFRQAQGDLNAIERQLARAGVGSVKVLPIHADAAFLATQGGAETDVLRERSGIDALYEVLGVERDQRGEQRRALSTVDRVRVPASKYLAALSSATAELAIMTETAHDITQDLQRRLSRQIDRHGDLLSAALQRPIEQRRTWHMSADIGKSIEDNWAAEMKALQCEVDAATATNQELLAEALKETAAQVLADWESLPLDHFRLGDFTGFGSVWMNRMGRAAVGLGAGGLGLWGGAAAGAKIGSLLGVEGGPLLMVVTGGVGAVIGAGVGLLFKPMKDVVNKLWHGKAWVVHRRHEELKRKIHPVLDEIESELAKWRASKTEQDHECLAPVIAGMQAVLDDQQAIKAAWLRAGQALRLDLDHLDKETAVAMLRMTGRERLASTVVRASRSPGSALAVEFTEEGFAEAALFAPVQTCEQMLSCGPPKRRMPAGQALPLALGACRGRILLNRLSTDAADLRLLDDALPSGITDAWGDLLSDFTTSRIRICAAEPDRAVPEDLE